VPRGRQEGTFEEITHFLPHGQEFDPSHGGFFGFCSGIGNIESRVRSPFLGVDNGYYWSCFAGCG